MINNSLVIIKLVINAASVWWILSSIQLVVFESSPKSEINRHGRLHRDFCCHQFKNTKIRQHKLHRRSLYAFYFLLVSKGSNMNMSRLLLQEIFARNVFS